MFSHVKAGKRSKELEDSLAWLVDVGLLRKKSGMSYETILEDSDLYQNFKGAFIENYVLTELLKQGISPYFWRSGNTAELDFYLNLKIILFRRKPKQRFIREPKATCNFVKNILLKLDLSFP